MIKIYHENHNNLAKFSSRRAVHNSLQKDSWSVAITVNWDYRGHVLSEEEIKTKKCQQSSEIKTLLRVFLLNTDGSTAIRWRFADDFFVIWHIRHIRHICNISFLILLSLFVFYFFEFFIYAT